MKRTAIHKSRRSFLKAAAVGAAGVALGPSARRVFGIGRAEERPNILWIMSDEHNPIVTGCYGAEDRAHA